jgi:hypothetical protein
MIIRDERERFAGGFRVIQYERDGDGRCVPTLRPPDAEAEIDQFYALRAEEFGRFYEQLCAGALSPVGFFLAYHKMSPKEVGPMVGLGARAVEKHAAPEGFARVTVDELKRYARVFDVAVPDFFSFVFVHGDLACASRRIGDRLLERIDVGTLPDGAP